MEPIQGTAGNVIPPQGFLRAIQSIAKEHDALLIADEMLTGFGRTGRMWGAAHEGVVPDIMTVGKGMGGGFPLSGVISTDLLTHRKPWSNPSASSSSYGGNPLAAAAGLATIEIILKENLVAQRRARGPRDARAARGAEGEAPRDRRGARQGPHARDRAGQRPEDEGAHRQGLHAGALSRVLEARSRGHDVLAAVRINPALVITEDAALAGLAILDEALEAQQPAAARARESADRESLVRGAIIGLGNVAVHGHVPGWRSRRDVEIAAATDADPSRRAALAEHPPGCRWYDSAEELMREAAVDFVDICTPPSSHAALIQQALARGLHVLCEKPLVHTPEELSALAEQAAAKNRVLRSVHNWHHAPIVRQARALVREGAIGQLTGATWQTLRMRPARGRRRGTELARRPGHRRRRGPHRPRVARELSPPPVGRRGAASR